MPPVSAAESPISARMALMLAAVHFLAYADRAVAAAFAPDIKLAFGLDDASIGALQGAPLFISYLLATLWAGRRLTRPLRPGRYIGLCLLLWTAAGAVFALAPDFPTLVGARLVFGLGQAAFAPVAVMLLAGAAPVRGVQPIAVFTAGSSTGRSGGLLLGGALMLLAGAAGLGAVLAPWRAAALALLLPNLLLAAVFLRWRAAPVAESARPGLMATLAWFRRWPATAGLYGAAACGVIVIVQSLGAWAPSILGRQFAVTTAEAGLLTGLAVLIGAPLGHLAAGRVAAGARFAARGPGSGLAAAALTAIAAALGLLVAPGLPAALAWITLLAAAGGFGAAAVLMGLQPLVPPSLHRGANSLFFVLITLVGTAGGPLVTGAVSDLLDPAGDRLTLSLAVVVASAGTVVALAALTGAAGWRRLAARVETGPDPERCPPDA